MSDETRPEELKIWLAVRKDIKMPLGKFAIQAGHGFLTAFHSAVKSDPDLADAYVAASQPKIACWVKDEDELHKVLSAAREAGLPCGGVPDEGRTVFGGEKTWTTVAVGPCLRSQLPGRIRRLRMIPYDDFDPQTAETETP